MSNLFDGCTELETITFGNNFNTKKVINMKYLFSDCTSLTSIDLSQFNTELVTDMTHLFSRCNSLESINLNYVDTSSVVDMSYMFYNCRSLKMNQLINFNTQKVTNMSFMFYGCKSFQSLNLTNFNTSSLIDMKGMFRNSNSLVTLDISTFNTRNVTTIAYLFAGCSKLKNLYNLSVLDSPSIIDKTRMFDGCYSLSSPDNPDYNPNYNGTITNSIVLLGFDNYNLISNIKKITFNIYFYSYEYLEYPDFLYLSASITYNSQLRLLQNENNVDCIKGEEKLSGIQKYECEISLTKTDINNINLNDSIDFGTENNLIISPLASEHINNLQNINNIDLYDKLFDNGTIFTLENPKLEQIGRKFNISGEMNGDPQWPIDKSIPLLVTYENEHINEINCKIADNDTKKYTINCNIINNTISYDLKNSMSIIDNDMLLIYFEDGNSIINISDTNKSNRRYYSKSNSGISPGAIVAIILCSILAIALTIVIFFCSKKNNAKELTSNVEPSSTKIIINKNFE